MKNNTFCMQKRNSIITFLMIVLFTSLNVLGQETIKGVVLDENGESMIGVNVLLSNGKGASTDNDGNFEFSADAECYDIKFQYIGYNSYEKKVCLSENQIKTLTINLELDTEELDLVVVSAGRFEQKIEEVTVSVDVLKPQLIQNKNTTDISSTINQAPGVNVTDGQANIRGGSGWTYGAGTRVLVLVDGIPMISGDAGQVKWSFIPVENIGQVEIIKGASSALYGSSALNGVINIRTKFPKAKPQSTLNTFFGMYSELTRSDRNSLLSKEELESLQSGIKWWEGHAPLMTGLDFNHARQIGNLDLTFGTQMLYDQTFTKDETIKSGRFNFKTNYKSQKIYGLTFGVNGNVQRSRTADAIIWESEHQPYQALNDDASQVQALILAIDPHLTYNGNKNQKIKFLGRYLKVNNDAQGDTVGYQNYANVYYTEFQYQKRIRGKHTLSLGALNSTTKSEAKLYQGNHSATNMAYYFQLDGKIKKLNYSLGGRYEHYFLEVKGFEDLLADSLAQHLIDNGQYYIGVGKPVFRSGLNYELREGTNIRASIGQGFRFPSIAELFIETSVSGVNIYSNPQLQPESGWSAELALKQGFIIDKWKGYFDIAAYIMKYDNMMEFSFGFWNGLTEPYGFKSINIGATKITGIEATLIGQGKIGKNNITFLGGYNYSNPKSLNPEKVFIEYDISLPGDTINRVVGLHYGPSVEFSDIVPDTLSDGTLYYQYGSSSNDSVGNVLKYRYKHLVKFDVEISRTRIAYGLSMRVNSFMDNIDNVFEDPQLFGSIVDGIETSRKRLYGPDILFDARLAYNISEQIKASIIVNNVFNRERLIRPANLDAPRTYMIQFRYSF